MTQVVWRTKRAEANRWTLPALYLTSNPNANEPSAQKESALYSWKPHRITHQPSSAPSWPRRLPHTVWAVPAHQRTEPAGTTAAELHEATFAWWPLLNASGQHTVTGGKTNGLIALKKYILLECRLSLYLVLLQGKWPLVNELWLTANRTGCG